MILFALKKEVPIMADIVGWYNKKIEKLRQLPRCHFLLFITVKFLAGVAIGLLLAIWLPTWMWWIFLVIAFLIAIPIYGAVCRK
jgi:hypothetical protein